MIVAVVQARVSSTRLPGKVLELLAGEPVIQRLLERVARASTVDQMVVATSVDPGDDPLAELCTRLDVDCFRGSLDDVLDRFYGALSAYDAGHLVRLTGDNPVVDPQLIDDVVRLHLSGAYDYTSNCLPPTFPDGLDVEVVKMSAFERAWREATTASNREHVTQYIVKRPSEFSLGCLQNDEDLSHLRWTVDEPADLEVVRHIFEVLLPTDPYFSWRDALSVVHESSELATRNAGFARNEGLARSEARDNAHGRLKGASDV